MGKSGARGRILQPKVQLQKGEGEMGRGREERNTQSLIWRDTQADTQHKKEDTWRRKTKKGPMEKRRRKKRHWATQKWT